jgi:hypothetical protein
VIFSLLWNGGASSGTVAKSAEAAKTEPPVSSKAEGVVPLAKRLVKVVETGVGFSGSAKSAKRAIPINQTYNGTVSGTLTITGSIDDTTGTGTVIESYVNFNDGNGYTYDGAVTVQVNGYDMANGVITDAIMSFTMWTIKSAGSDVSLSGSIRVQESVVSKSETMTINMDGRDNISKETFRFASFVQTDVFDNLLSPTSVAETVSGRLYVEKFGYVEVSTVSPCKYSSSDLDPSSGGPIILAGAGNSSARTTPVSASYVLIEVDGNGDGAYENKNAYAWSNLAGGSVKVVISISVTPANPSIAKGTTQQFSATGMFPDNSTQDLTSSATWSTSDSARAAITSSGLATGVDVGTTIITATSGGISGSAKLTVTPAVPVYITVSPPNPAIFKGTSQQFAATGTFSDNTVQDVTQSVAWGSSDTSVATIANAVGSKGQAIALTNGSTMITATSGGITGTATLTVANWTVQTTSLSSFLEGIAWSGTQLVAVGTGNSIFTSPDGVTWTQRGFGLTNADLLSVSWSGSQFIAVGGPSGINNTATILTSPDGITWTQQSCSITAYLGGVACSGALCVAAGSNGTILTSPDGVKWTLRDSGALNAQLSGVAWSGTQFVVVGNGAILTSPDGITWTRRADIPILLNRVVWSGTQFVAVGNGIFTSPDGITWTLRDVSNANGIAWSGSQYVAVGGSWSNSLILSSSDGVAWTSQTFGTTMILQSVVWAGTQFVAVGAGGTILTSP